MRPETAPAPGLRAGGMIVTAFAALLLAIAVPMFVWTPFQNAGNDLDVSVATYVRLELLGGLPALLLLGGAGYFGLQAARTMARRPLAWGAISLVLGIVWTFAWFIAVLATFIGE